MQKKGNHLIRFVSALTEVLVMIACVSASAAVGSEKDGFSEQTDVPKKDSTADETTASSEETAASADDDLVLSAVDFDHELDSYEPRKDHYNFYFTYKTVHPWWDAVALGMEEAQRQYLEKGIVIRRIWGPGRAACKKTKARLQNAGFF